MQARTSSITSSMEPHWTEWARTNGRGWEIDDNGLMVTWHYYYRLTHDMHDSHGSPPRNLLLLYTVDLRARIKI